MATMLRPQLMAGGGAFVSRFAAWVGDRLPRVEGASECVDWFFVGLVAGPCLMASLLIGLQIVDHVRHTSILASAVPLQRSLKAYAAAHSLADRQLDIAALIAGAYPPLLWTLVRIATRVGRRPSSAKPQQAR